MKEFKSKPLKGLEDLGDKKYSLQRLAQIDGGKGNKGITHTEQTKKQWSNVRKGRTVPKDVVEKSRRGIIQTKLQQILARASKQDILDAQTKHGNHQGKICQELSISRGVYKKLCNHYGIPDIKASSSECANWAITNQSEEVNVYRYDKSKEDGLGEYIGTYYSLAFSLRELGIPEARCHAVSVKSGKRPHTRGYVFRSTKQ